MPKKTQNRVSVGVSHRYQISASLLDTCSAAGGRHLAIPSPNQSPSCDTLTHAEHDICQSTAPHTFSTMNMKRRWEK